MSVDGIVEADGPLIRESARGSRRLAGRAQKAQWQTLQDGCVTRRRLIVIVRDRHKTTSDHVLFHFKGATLVEVLDPLAVRDWPEKRAYCTPEISAERLQPSAVASGA